MRRNCANIRAPGVTDTRRKTMRTITVEDNYHWKALQLNGANWRCIACDQTNATVLVTWRNHVGEKRFAVRYCTTCLPEVLLSPPLEQRLKLPERSTWDLKLSHSEAPCDICGSSTDLWEGIRGDFVLCPAHHSRRGYLNALLQKLRRTLGR